MFHSTSNIFIINHQERGFFSDRGCPIPPVIFSLSTSQERGFFSDQGCSTPSVIFCDATRISRLCFKSPSAFAGRDQPFISVMLQIYKCFCRERSSILSRWCYKSSSAFAGKDQPFISVIVQISSAFAGRDQCFISVMLQISKCFCRELQVGINLLSHWCYKSTNVLAILSLHFRCPGSV